MSKAAELAALIGSQSALSNRNLIINGAMQVAQRGTSVSGTIGFYGLDRWRAYASASLTVSQQSFTPGQTAVPGFPKYYMRLVPSTAAYNFGQRIEDLTTVGGKTLVMSFWIKGSAAATFDISYIRSFGSGGSSADTTEFASDVNITTSWTKVEQTFTVASLSGKTVGAGSYLQVNIGDSNAFSSSQTVEIALCQLELGETATPFEHRSYGDELARCQRYYQLNVSCSGGYSNGAGTQVAYIVPFAIDMRATPSATLVNGTNVIEDYYTTSRTATSLGTYGAASSGRSIGLVLNISTTTANKTHGLFGDAVGFDSEL